VAGKSTLLHLDSTIERLSVGNPAVADVTLISPVELYLLGKTFGTTNLILWREDGPTTIIDLSVSLDTQALRERLRALLPGEAGCCDCRRVRSQCGKGPGDAGRCGRRSNGGRADCAGDMGAGRAGCLRGG
jgi:hypothetical protein